MSFPPNIQSFQTYYDITGFKLISQSLSLYSSIFICQLIGWIKYLAKNLTWIRRKIQASAFFCLYFQPQNYDFDFESVQELEVLHPK